MLWHQTSLRWLMPSPNMPFPETAYVYPGQVLWEGTNISEGRGTCRPFEIFGAPFLNTKDLRKRLDQQYTKGCLLQELTFRPTFHKWNGQRCFGFMIHIIDYKAYRPYLAAIALLMAIIELHGEKFAWRNPPYEYEYEKLPIDILLGSSSLRNEIERGGDLSSLLEKWEQQIREYLEWRRPYLFYP
jgi:uncharacterized protein YbbC (DUF1343 family)